MAIIEKYSMMAIPVELTEQIAYIAISVELMEQIAYIAVHRCGQKCFWKTVVVGSDGSSCRRPRQSTSKKFKTVWKTGLAMDVFEQLIVLTAKLTLLIVASTRRLVGELVVCLSMPLDQPVTVEALPAHVMYNDVKGQMNSYYTAALLYNDAIGQKNSSYTACRLDQYAAAVGRFGHLLNALH
jgi:hypothetical protein